MSLTIGIEDFIARQGSAVSQRSSTDSLTKLRGEARDLLFTRLVKKRHESNGPLIEMLLGFSQSRGAQHCHRLGRDVDQALLESYRCAVGMRETRCVVAAIYRHHGSAERKGARSRRAVAGSEPFTELLLLAVDEKFEKQRLGASMVGVLRAQAAQVGSKRLLVLSAGPTIEYWHDKLRFKKINAEEASRVPVFWPWSDGTELLEARHASTPSTRPSAHPPSTHSTPTALTRWPPTGWVSSWTTPRTNSALYYPA